MWRGGDKSESEMSFLQAESRVEGLFVGLEYPDE